MDLGPKTGYSISNLRLFFYEFSIQFQNFFTESGIPKC